NSNWYTNWRRPASSTHSSRARKEPTSSQMNLRSPRQCSAISGTRHGLKVQNPYQGRTRRNDQSSRDHPEEEGSPAPDFPGNHRLHPRLYVLGSGGLPRGSLADGRVHQWNGNRRNSSIDPSDARFGQALEPFYHQGEEGRQTQYRRRRR